MAVYFPTAVYLLCFLTSAGCAGLLMRSYGRTRTRLLLWSAICFICLALNNLLLVIDLLLLPAWDFRLLRQGFLLLAVGVLLFGFIWDRED